MKKSMLFLLTEVVIICVMMTSCITGAPMESNQETANPDETTAETTLLQADSNEWQNVYVELLREKMQLHDSNISVFADNFDVQKYHSAFRGGGYPTSPFVYLFDIDCDDIPELIYIDASIGFDGDVYSYIDGSLKHVGKISFYPFGSLGAPLDKTEGLYSDIGYKGHYGEVYYYTLVDGELTEELALEYNNRPEVSDHPGSSYSFANFSSVEYIEITNENISEIFDLE